MSIHNFLLFWKGGEVEVVWAEKQPFIATLDSVEVSYYTIMSLSRYYLGNPLVWSLQIFSELCSPIFSNVHVIIEDV